MLLFSTYSNPICHSGPEQFLSGFVPALPALVFGLELRVQVFDLAGMAWCAFLVGFCVCVCVCTLFLISVYQLSINVSTAELQTTPKLSDVNDYYSQLYNMGWDQLGGSFASWLNVSHAAAIIWRLSCDGRSKKSSSACLIPQRRRLEPLGAGWPFSPYGSSSSEASPRGLLSSRLSWASLQHGS